MSNHIQLRGGTAAQCATANETPFAREIYVETDTLLYKIGDGVTPYNSLPYATLSGSFNSFAFNLISGPAAPASGLLAYAGAIAGRSMPCFAGPGGLAWAAQPFLGRNKVGYWCPPGSATTVPGVMGYTAPTALGTATLRTVTVGNTLTEMRRLAYVSATTAGSFAGSRVGVTQIRLGDGTRGGFMKIIRFGCSDAAAVSGARQFIGISSNVGVPTNVEPSTLTNSIGVGHGAADTNLKIYAIGSSAQPPVDLGSNFPANTLSADAYELALFSPPNQNGTIYWQVTRIGTPYVASGSVVSGGNGVTLPSPTLLMTYQYCWRCNNATALAVGLDVCSDYIETDN